MEIAKKYDPSKIEDKWYTQWMESGYFHSTPDDREPYCIVIPPPNVTGVLHMGHMLNNTIQDVLVRRARMLGKNACWVPGTDHASIATEAKVVNKLKQEGIEKSSLTREEFLKHAWEWTDKHGGIILEQLKKLGASCDWERTRFTMEDDLYKAVIDVFIDLYEKGLIYRGARMINWDPGAKTALSDEEVVYKEVSAKLYHVYYKIEGSDEKLVIATTRPETIMGDTAVCVHPEDERYSHLKGKKVIVPLVNRAVPLIQDSYVDREFGTGVLKVTPAHDINDYEIGQRHNLSSIDIFNDDGTLNSNAEVFVGEDRFVARKKAIKALEEEGALAKVEDLSHNVGFSERTDAVIEPKISTQWFLKMDELAKPALENVENDNIKFHPAKFKNAYRHWMANIKDWCISRQLWWGHRIPAYYYGDGKFVVAANIEEALEKARKDSGDKSLTQNDLRQDEDVLDTWFSSWLWPISVFNGIEDPDNEDIKYYYPTDDLVTAPEILFFWVARMIMAGYEYRGKKPFKNVYFTGIVRDAQRRKMSKQLGNSPDPLDLIAKYGADGVRVGMLFSSPAGNDLLFDESLCEQGRNFSNKIWNAFRLVKGWEVDTGINQPESAKVAIKWFTARLNDKLAEINDFYEKYRISDVLMTTYKLIWDDFCSWYLEMVKPDYQKPIDTSTLEQTIGFFDELLRILHPFMPFITEEIWQLLKNRSGNESIMISSWPEKGSIDKQVLKEFENAREVVTEIRSIRTEKQIANKDRLSLQVKATSRSGEMDSIIKKLGNLEEISDTFEGPENAATFVVRANEYFIPLAGKVDMAAEASKIQEELKYTRGFLQAVEKKLQNERFVNNAPEQVVEMEKKKKADAEAKIRALEEQLAGMN